MDTGDLCYGAIKDHNLQVPKAVTQCFVSARHCFICVNAVHHNQLERWDRGPAER